MFLPRTEEPAAAAAAAATKLLQSCPLFVTPWTVDRQVPLSMEFPRQGYLAAAAKSL